MIVLDDETAQLGNTKFESSLLSKLGGWSAVRPALGYDLCAREKADAVLAILVKVAES